MTGARGQAGDRIGYSLVEVRAQTKTSNFIYNVFARPSEPLSWLIVNFTPLSANAVSLLAGASGLLGGALYARQSWLPAVFAFAAFFLLDCCDGTIARLRGQSSRLGFWLDLACDRTVLAVAALTFGVTAFDAGDRVAATLCALYFALHCGLDLLWYREESRFFGQPPQAKQLVKQLEARRASARPETSGWMQNLSRVEVAIRPDPWVCNIVFLLGTCLFPAAQIWVVSAAILGLIWFNRAPVFRKHFSARPVSS